MSTIASALARLSDAEKAKLQVVFVTTDPARDTEKVLRTYLDRFNPEFVGVTGSIDRIDALGKPMGVFIKKGQKLPSGGYEVDHTANVIAVHGRQGRPRLDGRHLAVRHGRGPREDPEGRRMNLALSIVRCPSPARRRGSGTSGRCRSVPTRWRSSSASSPRSGWGRSAGWPAAARPGQIGDIALWAVPAGLIGARLYHVATDHDLYFGAGKHAVDALKVWHGGLGIWGAIAGGLFGAWLYTRRHNIRLRVLADALAPGLLLAQAIGRFGNYFNQELYGRPTKLPWGLEISPDKWPSGMTFPVGTTFHPTFLYEALWNLAGHRPAALPRPPLQARLRPGLRALRDDLHRRPRLDRVAAHRHHRAQQRARPALGGVDVDHPVRGRGGVLRGDRPAAPTARHPRALAVRRDRGRACGADGVPVTEPALDEPSDENPKDPSQTPPE